jgi:hypothetical protein
MQAKLPGPNRLCQTGCDVMLFMDMTGAVGWEDNLLSLELR